jgi:hypothetical protein
MLLSSEFADAISGDFSCSAVGRGVSFYLLIYSFVYRCLLDDLQEA